MSFNEYSSSQLGYYVEFVVDNRGKTPPTSPTGKYELLEINAIANLQKSPNFGAVSKFVDESTYKMWFRNGHPTRGDVLFSTVGTIGNVAFVSENRGCIAQNLIAIRSDKTKLSGEFLYYYLSQKKQKNMLIGLDIGSVQSSIKVPHLLSLKVKFPKLEVQIKVTKILSSIDNKIELNNKINKTLEEMAQAIFKSWFVDFEPFKDGEFIESELGMIPMNWSVQDIDSLFSFEGGSQPPKSEHIYEERSGYIRFIQNRDYNDNDSHKTYIVESRKNKTCDRTDIMMDKYGEAGKIRFGIKGAYNVALAKISPKNECYKEILRGYFSLKSTETYIRNSTMLSTRNSVNANSFKNLKIAIPNEQLCSQFTSIVSRLINLRIILFDETRKLSEIRDSLLPKLMSGEIRVPLEEVPNAELC